MSKREQTTGLPKDAKKVGGAGAGQGEGLDHEYHSRTERESQVQRYVLIGAGVVAVAVIVMLAIAFIVDGVIAPNRVVASVNGTDITVSQFQKRFQLEKLLRYQQLANVQQMAASFGMTQDQISQLITQQDPYKTIYEEYTIPDKLGLTVINTMVEEQLVRAGAKEKNVTVTAEQIQAEINTYFGYTPDTLISAALGTPEATATVTLEPSVTPTPFVSPTPSPTPTITPSPFPTATGLPTETPTVTPVATLPATATTEPVAKATQASDDFKVNRDTLYNDWRKQTGMSDADITAYFEYRALRTALRDEIAKDVGTTGVFVNARHILVATEDEAKNIITALQAGESFSELAKALSVDTSSGANGGALGWSPVTQYVAPFQEAVKAAAIGDIVGPVQSEFGYHIIQVIAREDRELDKDQVTQAKESLYQAWFKTYKESNAGTTQIFDLWTSYIPSA